MKNTGLCPKCGSREILRAEGGIQKGHNNVVLKHYGTIPTLKFICCGCGYTEEWVNEEDLHYIRKEKQKQETTGSFWK